MGHSGGGLGSARANLMCLRLPSSCPCSLQLLPATDRPGPAPAAAAAALLLPLQARSAGLSDEDFSAVMATMDEGGTMDDDATALQEAIVP